MKWFPMIAITVSVMIFALISCSTDGTTQPTYKITVDVNYIDATLDGNTVYITSYTKDGNVENDEIETVSSTINGSNANVELDNSGTGYVNGDYDIRAHIDKNGDGILTGLLNQDFVSFGSASVIDSADQVTISGPWGSYFSFQVTVLAPVSPDTTDMTLYLVVVGSGDTWDNYRYGGDTLIPPLNFKPEGIRFPDCWGIDDTYDLIGVIDMDGDGDLSSGDQVASILGIVVTGGTAGNQTINSGDWSTY